MKCNQRGDFVSMNQAEEMVKFLTKYSWIYDFKVTNILSDNVLEQIPLEWLTFLKSLTIQQFNDIFYSEESQAGLPKEVAQFIESYRQIKVSFQQCPLSSSPLSNIQKRGIKVKKEHEIVNFANFIEERCLAGDMTNIVDVGSGLGYLGEELTRRGFEVLGVEGSEGHSERAEKRKNLGNSHSFDTVHLKIDGTRESCDKLTKLVKKGSCLVGLHCCGDLTPLLVDIFLKTQIFSSLMLVSCCYHKMSPSPSKPGFERFPLSPQVVSAVKNSKKPRVFNGYMLRLGAQETCKRWLATGMEDHRKHMNNVGFRAVLEKVVKDNDIELKKKKRKGTFKSDCDNIDAFRMSLPERYHLDESKIGSLSQQIFQCFQENSHHFTLFEILTGLQFLLQSVIENLIHLDRRLYLQNYSDLSECGIFEIFDDLLSPRNKVIYAKK